MYQLPKISVIIPMYNAEAYIEAALQSVYQQTLSPFEIVLVDDGSFDNTAAIVSKYCHGNTLYIRQQNKGPASARNTGIRASKGDFVAFLDADDLWEINTLQSLFTCIIEDSALEIIRGYSKQLIFDQAKRQWQSNSPAFIPVFSTSLIRREVFDKHGLIDETLYLGEDVDWFLRATHGNAKIHKLHQVVHLCRMHPNKMTNKTDAKINKATLFKILKKSMERQRIKDDIVK